MVKYSKFKCFSDYSLLRERETRGRGLFGLRAVSKGRVGLLRGGGPHPLLLLGRLGKARKDSNGINNTIFPVYCFDLILNSAGPRQGRDRRLPPPTPEPPLHLQRGRAAQAVEAMNSSINQWHYHRISQNFRRRNFFPINVVQKCVYTSLSVVLV